MHKDNDISLQKALTVPSPQLCSIADIAACAEVFDCATEFVWWVHFSVQFSLGLCDRFTIDVILGDQSPCRERTTMVRQQTDSPCSGTEDKALASWTKKHGDNSSTSVVAQRRHEKTKRVSANPPQTNLNLGKCFLEFRSQSVNSDCKQCKPIANLVIDGEVGSSWSLNPCFRQCLIVDLSLLFVK